MMAWILIGSNQTTVKILKIMPAETKGPLSIMVVTGKGIQVAISNMKKEN